jgi:hypothetical protein
VPDTEVSAVATYEFPIYILFDSAYVSSDPKKTLCFRRLSTGEAWCIFETQEEADRYRNSHASRKRFRVQPVGSAALMLDLLRIAHASGAEWVHFTTCTAESGTMPAAQFRLELERQRKTEAEDNG